MVPAAPVNSPTWRKRTEEEREKREGLRHESEAEGRGKFAGVTEAEVGGGRHQAIWVREEERRRTGEETEEMSRQGHSSKTEGWG